MYSFIVRKQENLSSYTNIALKLRVREEVKKKFDIQNYYSNTL